MESEDLVEAASGAGVEPVELLVAGEDVVPELLAEVSTLGHAPRVIAVYRRADLPVGVSDVVLALWKVSDPGNVGTLLRTADAFSAGVALSADCADPTGPRALRASAGAVFRVPLCAWDDLPDRKVALVARGGVALADAALEQPLSFLLGSEREGLPDDLVGQEPGGIDSDAGCRRVVERGRGRRDRAVRARAPLVTTDSSNAVARATM